MESTPISDLTRDVLRAMLANADQPFTASSLADACGTWSANVSRVLVRLYSFGWIEELPPQGPARPWRLTADGIEGGTAALKVDGLPRTPRRVAPRQKAPAAREEWTVAGLLAAYEAGKVSYAVVETVCEEFGVPAPRRKKPSKKTAPAASSAGS